MLLFIVLRVCVHSSLVEKLSLYIKLRVSHVVHWVILPPRIEECVRVILPLPIEEDIGLGVVKTGIESRFILCLRIKKCVVRVMPFH